MIWIKRFLNVESALRINNWNTECAESQEAKKQESLKLVSNNGEQKTEG